MRMFGSPYLVYLYFLLAGCASQKSVSTGGGSKYSEDLSVLRPKMQVQKGDTVIATATDERKNTPYVEAKYAVNEQVDAILDSINRIHLSRKYVDGFTIQVYSGRREEALNIKRQLGNILPELSSDVQFTEPIFRVKAGKYYNEMEAQSDFIRIKRHYPAAIIIPDRIEMNP